jgi:CheY-like chemotaxis protein
MIGKRILLIDDDTIIREVMSETLTDMNYAVTAEESAATAIRIFAGSPEEFDLVLTDFMMPEMTGDTLSERIHFLRPDIPVVLITGVPEKVTQERVAAAGIRKVLCKGIAKTELFEALQEVLQQ